MAIEMIPPKRDTFPAEPPRRGLSALIRLCGWGGGAAFAMAALAVTIQTDIGRDRLRQAYAAIGNAGAVVAPVPPQRTAEKDAEIRALEAQLRTLTADRDRLAGRMASLERHLEDMTGSIQRQVAQQATQQAAAQAAKPAVSPPTVVAAAAPATPAAPVINPLTRPAIVDGDWPNDAEPHAHAEPEADAEPQLAVPLPPPRVIGSLAEPPPQPPLPPKQEYGIELGNAPTMDALRARWTILKANYGPLLGGLQPIAVRDRRPAGTEFRLVAGPLPNLAAARQLCTRFADARAACRATKINAESVVQR